MSVNTGRFTPHPPASACGTHQAVPSPHAAFVRPCARNQDGEPQTSQTREEDVVIVIGPNGPRIQFRNDKTNKREEE